MNSLRLHLACLTSTRRSTPQQYALSWCALTADDPALDDMIYSKSLRAPFEDCTPDSSWPLPNEPDPLLDADDSWPLPLPAGINEWDRCDAPMAFDAPSAILPCERTHEPFILTPVHHGESWHLLALAAAPVSFSHGFCSEHYDYY